MKERKVRVLTALMLMVLAVVATFNITYFTATEYYNRLLEDLQTQEARYKKLKEVTAIVDKYYVGEYDEADALEMAAAGYVAGLGDTWSGYYTAEQTAAIKEEDANQYVGIGVTYSDTTCNIRDAVCNSSAKVDVTVVCKAVYSTLCCADTSVNTNATANPASTTDCSTLLNID